MPLFILATKLEADTMKDLKHREKIGHDWWEKVKENCPNVKFHGHYALLGKYNFLDIRIQMFKRYQVNDGKPI